MSFSGPHIFHEVTNQNQNNTEKWIPPNTCFSHELSSKERQPWMIKNCLSNKNRAKSSISCPKTKQKNKKQKELPKNKTKKKTPHHRLLAAQKTGMSVEVIHRSPPSETASPRRLNVQAECDVPDGLQPGSVQMGFYWIFTRVWILFWWFLQGFGWFLLDLY